MGFHINFYEKFMQIMTQKKDKVDDYGTKKRIST